MHRFHSHLRKSLCYFSCTFLASQELCFYNSPFDSVPNFFLQKTPIGKKKEEWYHLFPEVHVTFLLSMYLFLFDEEILEDFLLKLALYLSSWSLQFRKKNNLRMRAKCN